MTGWPTRSLGDLCSVVGQRATVGTTPYLEIGNLDPKTKTYTFSDKPAVKGALLAEAGDVIVSRVRPSRGAITLLREKRLALSAAFTILRPHHEMAGAFLFYALAWNNEFLAYLGRHSKGGLYPTVPERDVLAFEIPLPPLPEQERIVRILDEAEALRRLRAQADERRSNLVAALFSSTFGDPTNLPHMKQPRKAIGDFAAVSYGLADKLDAATKPESGTRILTISNVRLDGSLDLSVHRYSTAAPHERAKARLQKWDLLFNWRNGSEEHVAKTAMWEEQIPGEVLHVSFLLRIRVNQDQVNPLFLWVLLNRLRATGFFKRNSRMQINTKFNATELSSLQLPLPPLELQHAFAADVAEIRRLEAEQAVSRQRLDDLFQSLLQSAFQGEL